MGEPSETDREWALRLTRECDRLRGERDDLRAECTRLREDWDIMHANRNELREGIDRVRGETPAEVDLPDGWVWDPSGAAIFKGKITIDIGAPDKDGDCEIGIDPNYPGEFEQTAFVPASVLLAVLRAPTLLTDTKESDDGT